MYCCIAFLCVLSLPLLDWWAVISIGAWLFQVCLFLIQNQNQGSKCTGIHFLKTSTKSIAFLGVLSLALPLLDWWAVISVGAWLFQVCQLLIQNQNPDPIVACLRPASCWVVSHQEHLNSSTCEVSYKYNGCDGDNSVLTNATSNQQQTFCWRLTKPRSSFHVIIAQLFSIV